MDARMNRRDDSATPAVRGDSRERLLESAADVIRRQGYAGTSVDDICRAAGVTKGAFFHHFRSKEELAVAAAQTWSQMADALFAAAPYQTAGDPLGRIRGYLDFRRSLLEGDIARFTCLVGTMVQETYNTHPAIRAACEASIAGHARSLEADILAAMQARRFGNETEARALALHMQAVIQGAFILAKATGNPAVATQSVDHLRRYIDLLFETRGERA
jgi:TetR/AcrR family transcriptional repressor of nem operon